MIEMDNHPRTLRQYVRLYLTGFAMGLADLIPGVSGGTMAFVLGIYTICSGRLNPSIWNCCKNSCAVISRRCKRTCRGPFSSH